MERTAATCDDMEGTIEAKRSVYEDSEAYHRIKGRITRSKERKDNELCLSMFISNVLRSLQCYSCSIEEAKRSMSFKEKDIRAMLHMLQMENELYVVDHIIYLQPQSITKED